MKETQPPLEMLPKTARRRGGGIPWLLPYCPSLGSHWSFLLAEPNWKPIGKAIKPRNAEKCMEGGERAENKHTMTSTEFQFEPVLLIYKMRKLN